MIIAALVAAAAIAIAVVLARRADRGQDWSGWDGSP